MIEPYDERRATAAKLRAAERLTLATMLAPMEYPVDLRRDIEATSTWFYCRSVCVMRPAQIVEEELYLPGTYTLDLGR